MRHCSCTHQAVDKEKHMYCLFFYFLFFYEASSWRMHVCWEYVLMWHQEGLCKLYVGVFTVAADEVNRGRYCSKDFKSRKDLGLEVIISEAPRLTGCGHREKQTRPPSCSSPQSGATEPLISSHEYFSILKLSKQGSQMNNRHLMTGNDDYG